MTDTLFTDQNDNQPQIDANKNYFEELVGDGKKFKTPEDLAKGKALSDSYIQILERRLDERTKSEQSLREEYNATASLREIADKIANATKHQQQTLDDEQTTVIDVQQPAMKPEDIQTLARQVYQQMGTERQQRDNLSVVEAKLAERFGSNYPSILKEQTTNLGLTQELVDNLARTSPKAFFKTMGLDDVQGDLFQAPPKTAQGFTPAASKAKPWSWYQNLKLSNPKVYNDPKTSAQMHKDFEELGDAFKDGDFNAFRKR